MSGQFKFSRKSIIDQESCNISRKYYIRIDGKLILYYVNFERFLLMNDLLYYIQRRLNRKKPIIKFDSGFCYGRHKDKWAVYVDDKVAVEELTLLEAYNLTAIMRDLANDLRLCK